MCAQHVCQSGLLYTLNSSTSKQLQKLHMIGPKRAELIVELRQKQPITKVKGAWTKSRALGLSRSSQWRCCRVSFFLFFLDPQLVDLTNVGMSQKMIQQFFVRNSTDTFMQGGVDL